MIYLFCCIDVRCGTLALADSGLNDGCRLAFAELAWRQPHILLLDEPTNHLDIETIEAMAMAINKFDGGVVLVSHDERLIELCADELWHVERRQVTAQHTFDTILFGT